MCIDNFVLIVASEVVEVVVLARRKVSGCEASVVHHDLVLTLNPKP